MKILGISGSPRNNEQSGVYHLVKTVLENTGCDYNLISLAGRQISGCIACLGCASDNICKINDDLAPLREAVIIFKTLQLYNLRLLPTRSNKAQPVYGFRPLKVFRGETQRSVILRTKIKKSLNTIHYTEA